MDISTSGCFSPAKLRPTTRCRCLYEYSFHQNWFSQSPSRPCASLFYCTFLSLSLALIHVHVGSTMDMLVMGRILVKERMTLHRPVIMENILLCSITHRVLQPRTRGVSQGILVRRDPRSSLAEAAFPSLPGCCSPSAIRSRIHRPRIAGIRCPGQGSSRLGTEYR